VLAAKDAALEREGAQPRAGAPGDWRCAPPRRLLKLCRADCLLRLSPRRLWVYNAVVDATLLILNSLERVLNGLP
jgi:hypothetical protein